MIGNLLALARALSFITYAQMITIVQICKQVLTPFTIMFANQLVFLIWAQPVKLSVTIRKYRYIYITKLCFFQSKVKSKQNKEMLEC